MHASQRLGIFDRLIKPVHGQSAGKGQKILVAGWGMVVGHVGGAFARQPLAVPGCRPTAPYFIFLNDPYLRLDSQALV